jgi:hypothetical protein
LLHKRLRRRDDPAAFFMVSADFFGENLAGCRDTGEI